MQTKSYHFQSVGIHATQSPLTLRKSLALADLFADLLPESDNFNLKQFSQKFFKSEHHIIAFLKIILDIADNEDNEKNIFKSYLDLTADELTEVLTDFLQLNKKSITTLFASATQSDFLLPILSMQDSKLNAN